MYTFKEYVKYREGATITGSSTQMSSDDAQLMNNPPLMKNNNPATQKKQDEIIRSAIQKKRQFPNVSITAAAKGAKVADQINQQ